jgi:hypothetical protein
MTTYTATIEAQTFTSAGHDGFMVVTGRPAGLVLQNAQAKVESAQRSVANHEANAVAYAGVIAADVLVASVTAAKKELRAAEKHLAEVSEVAKVQTLFWERKSLHASAQLAEKAAAKCNRARIIKLEVAA